MAHWRQALHLEPPQGWLNDPNGLCFFGGQYHVFFQYAPLGAEGSGPKGWGHWQSADLLHWTFAGMPLRPDTPWDQSGAYSGCAVPCGDTLRLYYTGNVKHPGPYDYIHEGRESNTLLVETPDGLQTGPKERLMESGDYPADCSLHVRDPKVWRENGLWKMLLGARSLADAGRALLYHSTDGRAWTLARVLELSPAFGYMWECPDTFTVGGRRWLGVCPQGLPHGETENQNQYQSGWFALAGDLETGTLSGFTEWDKGFDFYAPQTLEAPDGRVLLIGWMGMPDADYRNPTAALGWQHCLTLPRELEADGGGLRQRPLRELDALAEGAPFALNGETRTVPLPFRLRMTAEGAFTLTLAGGLTFTRRDDAGLLELRFTDDALGGGRTVRRARWAGGPLTVDLVADRSALEFYCDGGRLVFATRWYPGDPAVPVTLQGAEATVQTLGSMTFTL